MHNVKTAMIPLLLSALVGCEINGRNEELSQTNKAPDESTELVGINIEKAIQHSTVVYTPPTDTYYGKLKVSPRVYKNLIKGPEAQQLKDYLFSLFGTEKNEFVITLNAHINEVSLPPAILVVYKYDSNQRTWFTRLSEIYMSPIFNVSSHAEVDYTLSIQSSRDRNTNLVSTAVKANEAMKVISSGTWVVNKLAEPVVAMGALKIDKELGKLLTSNSKSELNSKLFPLSRTGSGLNSYEIKSNTQETLADITVELEYYNSLIVGEAISHNEVAKATKPILPEAITNPRALSNITVKRYGEKDRSLLVDINSSKPTLLERIRTTTSSTEMNNLCSQLNSELESQYDLNNNDINFVMYDLLSSSSYVTHSNSLNVDQCLTSSELKNLNDIGLYLEFGHVDIDIDFLDTLSGYLRTPISNQGHKTELENFFEESVYFESDVDYLQDFSNRRLSRGDLIEQLGKVGANRAGNYTFGDRRETVSVFYNHHNELSKIYKLTLNHSGSSSNRIGVVKIEYAKNEEISSAAKSKLEKESQFANESSVKPTTVAANYN
ncbi:hypothetical protein [Vibrio alginolyticus]|uniref:hypothetical protein n=1 Tax=Vibrio alginolyticus TaxID=663 RepID=UPI001C9C9ADB|nr:hypothetical protein [Vibrio alginolyticus]MBY7682327.1 hypothetical protein [Vibrio alginolyticus]